MSTIGVNDVSSASVRSALSSIAAVIVEEMPPEAMLKRYYHKENRIELVSENPDHPPWVFKGRDCGKVRVLGRYAGIVRKSGVT